jgi:hypothetical protein
MSDSPKNKGFLERAKKTCVKFKRDLNRRRKLIEILLLVGTITAAFNKSAYIMAKDEKEHSIFLYICSIFISITFVGILLVNLVINIPEANREFFLINPVVPMSFLACIYILFQALSPPR